MLVTARNYGTDPKYTFESLLGYGQLSPRQSRRLIRACNDLWARDNALDEIERAKSAGKGHKWSAETVLLIQDTEEIARRYGVDVADGFLFGEAEGSGETPDELFGGVS